jgi:hypothetical protein
MRGGDDNSAINDSDTARTWIRLECSSVPKGIHPHSIALGNEGQPVMREKILQAHAVAFRLEPAIGVP